MTLDETIYISELYNIYGELLTAKQSEILENYIFDNLSLGEIAQIFNISRQAVLDSINKSVSLLNKYETILKIKSNNLKVTEVLKEIKDNVTDEKLINKINNLLETL